MTEDTFFRPKMGRNAGKDQGPAPTPMGDAATELLKTASDSMKAVTASRVAANIMNPSEGGGTAQENTEAINTQLVTIFNGLTSTLTNMIEMERKARQAAEETTSQTRKDYFTLIADSAKDVQQRIQNMQPTQPMTLKDKIEEMHAWNDLVGENAKSIAAQVLANARPAQSSSGMTQIDVELKRLEMDSNRGLEQLKQSHELAMKTLDIELSKLHIETIKWERGQASKQSWFEDLIGAFGQAFTQGASGQPLGGGIPAQGAGAALPGVAAQPAGSPLHAPRVGRTAAGLIGIECSNPACMTKFAAVPGMERVHCPHCNAEYVLADLVKEEE